MLKKRFTGCEQKWLKISKEKSKKETLSCKLYLQFALVAKLGFPIDVSDFFAEQQCLFKEEDMSVFALLSQMPWIPHWKAVLEKDLTKCLQASLLNEEMKKG